MSELSRQLTTAPDYLLKSSLLRKNAEQLTDRSSTTLHWKEPSEFEVSRKLTQMCKSSTPGERDVTFAKIENTLLSSQLAASLIENRLLKQLETRDISQKMSQLCVVPSLKFATKEEISDACSNAVVSSVPCNVRSTVPVSKSVHKQQKIKRKERDTNVVPVVEKPQLKHIKKTKMPEPVNNDEVIPSFEPPNYELMHEDVKGDEVVLFVPPEKEEMVQQLLRPVADISSLKVVIQLPSI